jgi:putative membrane protein
VDALTVVLAVTGGALAGLASGLVPGLHVNTVCVVAIAFLPGLGPAAAVGLAAMAAAHACSSLLPSTFLGAPGEETLLSALPAHRMLLDGKGPDAVQAGLHGGLLGLAAAVLLALPYKWLLGEPGRGLVWVEESMVAVLAGILLLLVARESRRGAAPVAWAVVVLALSATLGLLGARVAVEAWVGVPATPLLPMLSGLFGAPALLETMRARPDVPPQMPASRAPARLRRMARWGALSGVAAAAATAVLPGLTSSVAAAAASAGRRDDDARPMLATLSALAMAHLVLTFVVLWLSLRARTGLAVAVQQTWSVAAWSDGAPPLALRMVLLACVAGALLGTLGTAALARPAAIWLPRLPQHLVAAAALAILVGLVALFSGWSGLGLFAVACCVGLVPLSVGLGRVHLTGCLLVPVLLHRAGWA